MPGDEVRPLISVPLYEDEIDNILAAYDALCGRSPFFGFNEPTKAIIRKLKGAKERR